MKKRNETKRMTGRDDSNERAQKMKRGEPLDRRQRRKEGRNKGEKANGSGTEEFIDGSR